MSVMHLLGTSADGGAETYFLDLVRALAKAPPAQAAALRRHPGREATLMAAGVAVETFGFGGPIDLLTRPRIAAFAQGQDARLLVAWMNRAARHAPRGAWKRVGRLGGYYKLKYYRGFDHLVANTRDIERWIVRQGWPREKASYIPNFAEAPAEAAPQPRTELATPEDASLLVTLGRLHPAKAQDVAIAALAQLPDTFLWIAGAGPLEAKLKAQAHALGVSDRVRFLGWRSDASRLYAAADVCLFPSRYEPLGNVVIQAWAHGLPVVAAASQGPAALIREGEDGLLVPVDDAESLAAAARRLIVDPALRGALAAAGRARVAAEFSEAVVTAEWRALFARLGAA